MNYCKERLSTDKVFEFCNIFCFHVFISCNTNKLHLLFQKGSCLSHCSGLWVLGCLPSPGTTVGLKPSWALLGWALVTLKRWRVGTKPPNVTLLFGKGKGRWEWRLSAGTSRRVQCRVSCTCSLLLSELGRAEKLQWHLCVCERTQQLQSWRGGNTDGQLRAVLDRLTFPVLRVHRTQSCLQWGQKMKTESSGISFAISGGIVGRDGWWFLFALVVALGQNLKFYL